MAERERLTKKERRERARQERRERELAEARRARRQRRVAAGITVVSVAVVAAVVALVVTNDGGDELAEPVSLAATAVADARSQASCEVVATGPSGGRDHVEAGTDPAAVLSDGVQPPTGDVHLAPTHPLVRDGADSQLDVLALGHNLEHGAVMAWYDPEQVDDATIAAMEQWSEQLNNSGFAMPAAGAGIFVAPFTDPGISSGEAVALRSWNLGVDCGSWNETAANSFVIEAFGQRGGAPEGVPFPDGTIGYADDAPEPFASRG